MLAIVAAALALPTIFIATNPEGTSPTTLSLEVAGVMFVLYILYLIYYFTSEVRRAA